MEGSGVKSRGVGTLKPACPELEGMAQRRDRQGRKHLIPATMGKDTASAFFFFFFFNFETGFLCVALAVLELAL
jgi:hypothetical protein